MMFLGDGPSGFELIIAILVVCIVFTLCVVGTYLILSALVGTFWTIVSMAAVATIAAVFMSGIYIGSNE